MIELKNIGMSYNDHEVLHDLTVNIKQGELISIMGKSGSGKSTLLNILGFLDEPTKGEYFYKGQKVVTKRQKERIRKKDFSYVYQSYNLISGLTVKENIMLPLLYTKKMRLNQSFKNELQKLMNSLDLQNKIEERVEKLSGGEQQRVSFIRAILSGAETFFMDEPTGNLDFDNTQVLMELVLRLNEQGKTIIIVTHDKAISQKCTRHLILENGGLKDYEI